MEVLIAIVAIIGFLLIRTFRVNDKKCSDIEHLDGQSQEGDYYSDKNQHN